MRNIICYDLYMKKNIRQNLSPINNLNVITKFNIIFQCIYL